MEKSGYKYLKQNRNALVFLPTKSYWTIFVLLTINFMVMNDPKYSTGSFNHQININNTPFIHKESSRRTPIYIYFVHGYGATNSQFSHMIEFFEEEWRENYVNKRPLFFDYFSKYLNSSFSIEDVHNIKGGITTYSSDLFTQLVKAHPNGAKIDIIAHSLGGLILRELLRNYRDRLEDKNICIKKVVTLGTPHLGTKLAVHPLKEIATNFMGHNWQSPIIKSVSPTSNFILQLNHKPELYMNGIKWFFIAGQSDEIINIMGQVVIYDGITCDGFVDSKSALGLGLEIQEVQREVVSKNHLQLINDPPNRNSYRYIYEWLIC